VPLELLIPARLSKPRLSAEDSKKMGSFWTANASEPLNTRHLNADIGLLPGENSFASRNAFGKESLESAQDVGWTRHG
jgi:hypothetical protein